LGIIIASTIQAQSTTRRTATIFAVKVGMLILISFFITGEYCHLHPEHIGHQANMTWLYAELSTVEKILPLLTA
jgi:hypothetical protein